MKNLLNETDPYEKLFENIQEIIGKLDGDDFLDSEEISYVISFEDMKEENNEDIMKK